MSVLFCQWMPLKRLKVILKITFLIASTLFSCESLPKNSFALNFYQNITNENDSSAQIRLWVQNDLKNTSRSQVIIFVDGTDFSLGAKTLRIQNKTHPSFEQDFKDILKADSLTHHFQSIQKQAQIILLQFPFSAQMHPIDRIPILYKSLKWLESQNCSTTVIVGLSQGALISQFMLDQYADSLKSVTHALSVDGPFLGARLPKALFPMLLLVEKSTQTKNLRKTFCSQDIKELVIEPNLEYWCSLDSIPKFIADSAWINPHIWPLLVKKNTSPKKILTIQNWAVSSGAYSETLFKAKQTELKYFKISASLGKYYWPKTKFKMEMSENQLLFDFSQPLKNSLRYELNIPHIVALENDPKTGSTLRLPGRFYRDFLKQLKKTAERRKLDFKNTSELFFQDDIFISTLSSIDQFSYADSLKRFNHISYAPKSEYHVFEAGGRLLQIIDEEIVSRK